MNMDITRDNIGGLIEKALAEKELKVYYQPKHNAINGKIQGAEALARWKMSDGVMISPGMFIPLLEELGLITELDWYMLRETCAFLAGEIKAGRHVVTVSVNFSRFHAKEPKFAERLAETVDSYGIPRKLIEVEITESALAFDGVDIIQFVRTISDAGFEISIDDFGSGLSSLNLVKDVPASVMKIDKSLLSGTCEDEKERIV
ncbi:MAG: EAL domain-containing protein, partial [Oscillospiraceae bacterium]|nr:EAL domain-containing protein [Oscillospiraceae bacterium]